MSDPCTIGEAIIIAIVLVLAVSIAAALVITTTMLISPAGWRYIGYGAVGLIALAGLIRQGSIAVAFANAKPISPYTIKPPRRKK